MTWSKWQARFAVIGLVLFMAACGRSGPEAGSAPEVQLAPASSDVETTSGAAQNASGAADSGDDASSAAAPGADEQPAVAAAAADSNPAGGAAPGDEPAETTSDTTVPDAAAPADSAAQDGGGPGGTTSDASSGSANPAGDAAPADSAPAGSDPAAPASDSAPDQAAIIAPPVIDPNVPERPAGWIPGDPSTHLLSIERLRRQSYPGSDLVVEQTLDAGRNYSRYVVSYLSEGLKIYALFTIPNGDRPATGWPVVIFNHGHIPPAQYRTTERYVAYQDAFARNGYITLKSDYRGHGSSEGDAPGGRGSPAYTTDVLNGMASVARHADADPNRIGMWGHSMGGSITLRAMVLNNQIKAGVIWAGVVASYSDMYHRLGQEPLSGTGTSGSGNPSSRRSWRQDLIEQFGTPDENPAAWNAMSPNAYLAEISGPLQLHHGTADHSVPVAYSERLHEQMVAAGKTSENLVYQGDDHNLSQNLSTALARSVEFFDRHVKGAP